MGALETLQRRKLSVDDFHRMGEAGILGEDDRIELIDGLQAEAVVIHREPSARGYVRVFTQPANESLSPQLLPNVEVDLAQLWRR